MAARRLLEDCGLMFALVGSAARLLYGTLHMPTEEKWWCHLEVLTDFGPRKAWFGFDVTAWKILKSLGQYRAQPYVGPVSRLTRPSVPRIE